MSGGHKVQVRIGRVVLPQGSGFSAAEISDAVKDALTEQLGQGGLGQGHVLSERAQLPPGPLDSAAIGTAVARAITKTGGGS